MNARHALHMVALLVRGLLAAGCLAALVGAPWSSPIAGAAAPALAVEPARGPCDGRFVARGRGFVPGEEVMVYVRPEYVPRTAPPAGAPARADARGSFAVPIPGEFVSCLPSKAPDGAQPHEVTAVALSGRAAASFVAIPAPRRCFPATGHCVAGRFLTYWEANGGLARNGYPLSDVFVQRLEDGQEYAVQYFERVRLEAHEEVFDVLLGQFGRRILATVPGAPTAPVPPVSSEIKVDRESRSAGIKVIHAADAVVEPSRVTGGKDVTADGAQHDPFTRQAREEHSADRRGVGAQPDDDQPRLTGAH